MTSLRPVYQIVYMRDDLEQNIQDHGWDCAVDAASKALSWALGEFSELGPLMDRPDDVRRREWIARGGNPEHWPIPR